MRYKTCSVCKRDRSEIEFIKGRSAFLPGGYSIVCTGCLETLAPANDLEAIDSLMRWLDLPFLPGPWTQLYKMNGEHTLGAYISLLSAERGKYNKDLVGWKEMNERWLAAKDAGLLDLEIEELSADWVKKMEKAWPGNYSREDYEFLENLYAGLKSSYGIASANQEREGRQMCKLSLTIDKKIAEGHDVSKEIKSYLDLKKAGGFEAKDAKNLTDFDSVSELVVWLGKKGFQPSFANEKKDIVDITIGNVQDYLRRLVLGEPTLADQVEKRKASYELSKQMEETEEVEKFETSSEPLDFEGAQELDNELGDFVDT